MIFVMERNAAVSLRYVYIAQTMPHFCPERTMHLTLCSRSQAVRHRCMAPLFNQRAGIEGRGKVRSNTRLSEPSVRPAKALTMLSVEVLNADHRQEQCG